MADDKSLLEDILNVRKKRFKDALFDNDGSQISKNNFVSENENKNNRFTCSFEFRAI